jgi:hypothetical protein
VEISRRSVVPCNHNLSIGSTDKGSVKRLSKGNITPSNQGIYSGNVETLDCNKSSPMTGSCETARPEVIRSPAYDISKIPFSTSNSYVADFSLEYDTVVWMRKRESKI